MSISRASRQGLVISKIIIKKTNKEMTGLQLDCYLIKSLLIGWKDSTVNEKILTKHIVTSLLKIYYLAGLVLNTGTYLKKIGRSVHFIKRHFIKKIFKLPVSKIKAT